MNLRTSRMGMLFWSHAGPVWDDYVNQRQYTLTDDAVRLLLWFGEERRRESAAEALDGRDCAELLEQMVANGALLSTENVATDTDAEVAAYWRPWGAAARHYHFASRTLRTAPYLSVDDDRSRLASKAALEAPPPLTRTVPHTRSHTLQGVPEQPLTISLAEALASRRSMREFTGEAVSISNLSTLLRTTFGLVPRAGRVSHGDGSMFRTSPSGGARHPVEGFVYVSNVEGLEAGYYHYDHVNHELRLCAAPQISDVVEVCGGQPWVADASAVIFYVGVSERSMWKYNTTRAYRALMMDVGHLSQTAFLTVTALGLGATYTAALRDEILEETYQLDPVRDVVLGATVVGVATSSHISFLRGVSPEAPEG